MSRDADSPRSAQDGEAVEFDPNAEGPINMDYYHATRRKPRPPTWPYLISAVVMLILLVGIVFYQDSCGSGVSELLFPDK